MRIALIATCSAAALLAGCTAPTARNIGAAPPPADAIIESDGGGSQTTPNYSVVRDFLLSGQSMASIAKPDRPRAFVVLPSGKRKDNIKFCRSYMALAPAASVLAVRPNAELVTTYWPLAATAASSTDCEWLVDHYDANIAAALRSAFHLKSSGRYVLAIDPKNEGFYIDLTGANAEARTDALENWFAVVAGNPGQPGVTITSRKLVDDLCATATKKSDLKDAVLDMVPGAVKVVGGILWKAVGKKTCKVSATIA